MSERLTDEELIRIADEGVQRPGVSVRAIARECIASRKLIDLQEKLLVCYRLGKHPSDKLLDEIHKLKSIGAGDSPATTQGE